MKFQDYCSESLMWVVARPELVFVRGEGMWLADNNGKKYLDFVQGWAVNSLGHCPPCIAQAAAEQASKLINPSPAFYNEEAIALAKLLTDYSCFQRVFFTNSGAEANEGAIKLARKWGKKFKDGAFEIITFHNSFHGRTLATMSASGKPGWDTLYAPQVPGFLKADFNDIDTVEKLISPKTAAVMLEPIQGEGGVIPASAEFLQQLRELTSRQNVLLVVDEIQTGCGRTGKLFAYQHFGISPDIMTLGKGIGGGVPLGALLAREEICCFEAGDQGGTFNGNPFIAAIGLAVIKEILSPGFLEQVTQNGDYLSRALSEFTRKNIALPDQPGSERGMGLLRAMILGPNYIGSEIVEAARNLEPLGLLLNSPRPNLLRFMPALNVSKTEIDQMCELLGHALKKN